MKQNIYVLVDSNNDLVVDDYLVGKFFLSCDDAESYLKDRIECFSEYEDFDKVAYFKECNVTNLEVD